MPESNVPTLSFERVEMEGSEVKKEHTTYVCRIKYLGDGMPLLLHVTIDLPHADRKFSELQREIANRIHKATSPDHRLA
jgi:hypothetical protein